MVFDFDTCIYSNSYMQVNGATNLAEFYNFFCYFDFWLNFYVVQNFHKKCSSYFSSFKVSFFSIRVYILQNMESW